MAAVEPLLGHLERSGFQKYRVDRHPDVVRIFVEHREDDANAIEEFRLFLVSTSFEIQPTHVEPFSAFLQPDPHGVADMIARRRIGNQDILVMIHFKIPSEYPESPIEAAFDRDFANWAQAQARLIREGRWNEVDTENVAEEIDDLSKSQHRELRSRLRILIMHLLKWDHQPERRTGSWISSVIEQRARIEDLLHDSPSLRGVIESYANAVYETARKEAEAETGLPIDVFPPDLPYTVEQLMATPLHEA